MFGLTKKFNGLDYFLVGFRTNKKNTKNLANKIKKEGGKIRIVKTVRGYKIYSR